MHVAVGQAAAAEPPGAQSAQSAAAKEVVEQPSAAAATPRSPEPPEAPPEPERIPATPVESCFDCLIFGAFFFLFCASTSNKGQLSGVSLFVFLILFHAQLMAPCTRLGIGV